MEFKVRTKKLRNSAGTIRSTASGLRSARSAIENVIRNVDVGNSTEEIRRALRKSTGSLDTLSSSAGRFRSNLEAIATEYELTEYAIANQRKHSLAVLATNFAASLPGGIGARAANVFIKGKKWWDKYIGDPVGLSSGNFVLDLTDMTIGDEDGISFIRFYNSRNAETGSMGHGWVHNYGMNLRLSDEGAAVVLPDGSDELFSLDNGRFIALGGLGLLEKQGDRYCYTAKDDTRYLFDSQGVLIRRENSNGYGHDLEYSDGRLTAVTADNGDSLSIGYSANQPDFIASVTDHSGRTVRYSYDGCYLSSVTDGDRVTGYKYDRDGNLSDVTDPRGITIVHNEYDDQGRVIRQFFPDDTEMRYTYDDEKAVTIVCEKDGTESYHFHDDLFRNTDNLYRNGTESLDYGDKNLVSAETDRNENEIKYQYDNRGNVSKVTRPDGTVINMTYQKNNKLVTMSVNGVRKIKNVYDDSGNLLETTDAIGRKASYKYNERGQVTEARLPGGGIISFAYDEKGNMIRSVDPLGAVTTNTYDELNRLTGSTNGRGHTTTYEYDRYGNLTGVTDPAGNSRHFRFNEINRIEEFTDFNGARTILEYNKLGFASRMTDPLGRVTEDEYDKMWNHSVRRMPNGAVIRFEYDENGNIVREIDPLGSETSFEYDGNGNVLFRTDPDGAVTEFRYDSFDNLVYVRDPEGNETEYKYDACNNLIYVRNANGGEVRLEYDGAEQLIRETNALGESREYAYTPDGDVSMVTDEAGRVTLIEYTANRKPARICTPDGNVQSFTYDENGNVSSQSTNRGYKVDYIYDELDRLTETRDNNGAVKRYTYDAAGNLTSAEDQDGNRSVYEYTLTGKLSSVTDELGCRTEYTYDELDMLVGVSRIGEGEIHTTEYVRDIAGQVTKVTDPLGFTENYVYNGKGELTQKTDKDGYLTKFGYDRNGELTSIIYDDGREVVMKHDALGKLSEISDWTGVTSVESDILGRIVKVTYPDSRTAEYTYGKCGERTALKYPDGRVVKYGYDRNMRLTSLTEGDTKVDYSYDELGQLVSKVMAGGIAASYSYDSRGNLSEITSRQGDRILESARINYDLNGNRESVRRMREGLPEESGFFEYGYDPTGRLTSVRREGELLREYTYDAFGNRKSLYSNGCRTEYIYDAMDRLIRTIGASDESFRYDSRGNMIERSTGGSISGTFVYDPSGRLSQATGSSGTIRYEYNGLGHRVEELFLSEAEPQHRINYTADMTKYYDNLFERNIDGLSEAYIWDGTALAAKSAAVYQFINDDMGSPARLIGMDGACAASYAYDEFGTTVLETSDVQPFRYSRYRKDEGAGMYFVQAREYMPEHGRFAGQDDLKGNTVNPATLNPYVYCGDMPFVYYDPNGMWLHIVVGAIVGGVVGGGMELGKQLVKQAVSGEGIDFGKVNWGKVCTSTAGGVVEGGMLAFTGNPYAAAAAGGLVEGFSESYFVEGKGFGESIANGVTDAAVGAAFVGIGKGLKKITPKWFSELTTSETDELYKTEIKIMRDVWKTGEVTIKDMIPMALDATKNGIIGGFSSGIRKYLKPSKYLKKMSGGFPKCALGIS